MLVVISYGLVLMWLRLMFMFIVMKNSFSSRFLNGLICVFSLCWNFELDSSMLVRNVFRLGLRFVFCMNQVVFSIISRVVVVNIFGLWVWVMMLNILCSIGCLYRIIMVSVLSVMVVFFQCRVLFFVLFSSGMVVSSGIVIRFWNRRMVKFSWLWLLLIVLCLDSSCRFIVVDDSVSVILIISVFFYWKWLSSSRLFSISLDIVICVVFVLNIECCIIFRCVGDSFRLIMNSSIIMLILVVLRMWLVFCMKFSLFGFSIMLVVRQFSIVLKLNFLNIGMVMIVVSSSIRVSFRLLLCMGIFGYWGSLQCVCLGGESVVSVIWLLCVLVCVCMRIIGWFVFGVGMLG